MLLKLVQERESGSPKDTMQCWRDVDLSFAAHMSLERVTTCCWANWYLKWVVAASVELWDARLWIRDWQGEGEESQWVVRVSFGYWCLKGAFAIIVAGCRVWLGLIGSKHVPWVPVMTWPFHLRFFSELSEFVHLSTLFENILEGTGKKGNMK